MYGRMAEPMIQYPCLEIDTELIYQNARILRELCLKRGIEPTAVVKGYNGLPAITQAIVKAGFTRLASSRLSHLRQIREQGLKLQTLALRIPMLSEIAELVQCADISLNSQWPTLAAINAEAEKQGKMHQVILMRDLGDLREGVIDADEFLHLAQRVEANCPRLRLIGIGVNLTCYGSVIPSTENLSQLVAEARQIERMLGRKLEIISGGSTSTLPLLVNGGLPEGITDLRLGEALIVPCDLLGYWQCAVPGLSNRTLLLKAEIIEIGDKPTMPHGQQGVNAFGSYSRYQDRGIRRRALLALGVYDVGDIDKLIPLDADIHILGGSSDHLIIDIEDSPQDYQLGDIIPFELHYQAMLFATGSEMVHKIIKT